MRRIMVGLAAVAAFVAAGLGLGPDALEQLRKDAAAVKPLVKAECVRSFLDGTAALPDPGARVVYYQREPKAAFTEEDAAKLPQEQRDKLRKIDFDAAKYYDTFYGSPLAYSRALDLCAAAGLDSYEGKRILDYGYGTVGHLRLLASCGAEATGVDVDPILRVLYGRPEDQGEIAPAKPGGKKGRLALVDGFWPGTSSVREKAGSGMDLFISKNTLKNGYVHPPQGTDPRRALTLGVSDEEYVRALAQTVKPGGLVMIYNIGPAPAKEGEPFKTMADIRCPFSKEMWAAAGFELVEFEKDDTAAVRTMAKALGWDQGEGAMDLEHDLFASYTLARRKP
jgi:hypothetical protein